VDEDVTLKAGDNITVGPATFTSRSMERSGQGGPGEAPEPTVDKETAEALAGSSLSGRPSIRSACWRRCRREH
jgi:hypothetical protein